MTRTGLLDDYVYCTSEGEEVGTPEEEDDERSVLTENHEKDDEAEAEEDEEDVWKDDDDLSLSTASDSIDVSCEVDPSATAEVAALRWQVHVLKQTLAAQRLANEILRRRVSCVTYDNQQDEAHRSHRANAEGSWKPSSSRGESRHHNISALNDKEEEDGPIHHLSRSWFDHPEVSKKILLSQVHLVFACLAYLVYILLNGGGADIISVLPCLKLFLCSRGLLSWTMMVIAFWRGRRHAVGEDMATRNQQVLMEDAKLLLWVVVGVVQAPGNSPTALVAALVASLAVDYASDIVKQQLQHSSRARKNNNIMIKNESLATSIGAFVGQFFAWETYIGLPLLPLLPPLVLILVQESTMAPQSCAVLALQTIVHMTRRQWQRRRRAYPTQQQPKQHVRNDPYVLLVLHGSAWCLYRLHGFGFYFVYVAGWLVVRAVQGDNGSKRTRPTAVVTAAKKRD
jgi:hypothetical protein